MKSTAHDSRQKQFKNLGRHEEMRRRRTEGSLELRKAKKDDSLMKRRNMDVEEESEAEQLEGQQFTQSGSTDLRQKPVNQFTLNDCVALLKLNEGGEPAEADIQKSIEGVRRILSRSKSPPVQQVIDAGFVPILINAIQLPNGNIQFEAAWALTNIVSGTSEETTLVVNSGGLPPLIQLLGSTEERISEQATWAIGNIIGDCASYRDLVIQNGGAHALVALMQNLDSYSIGFVRTIAWSFSNLCRHKDPHPPLELIQYLAPHIVKLLHQEDKQVVMDACWALSYVTDGPDEQIECVLAMDVVKRLRQLLLSGEPSLMAPALRTLGNIVTGSDQQTQHVINAGVLGSLKNVLKTGSQNLAKECCWMLSNVLAGTREQIQAVIDSQLLPCVIECLNRDAKTQLEASWCIANLCQGGSHLHVMQLVDAGALQPICAHLDSHNIKLVLNLLDTLLQILNTADTESKLEQLLLAVEECGGVDKLEMLQEHDNEQIYSKALLIIEKYFADEEEKENAVPVAGGAATAEGKLQMDEGDVQAAVAAPAGGFAF